MLILDAIEDRIGAEMLELQHLRYATAAAFTPASDPDGETGAAQSSLAVEAYIRLGRKLLPWYEWPTVIGDKLTEGTLSQLITVWEQEFGKLDSPKVKTELAKLKAQQAPKPGVTTYWLEPEKG